MKKQSTLSLIILLMVSLACKALAAPIAMPTPPPSPQPLRATLKPSTTWTPTATSTHTPTTVTPTESPVGEFQFSQILALDFQRADWHQQGDALTSRSLSGCAVISMSGGEFPLVLPETVIAGYTWQISYSTYLLNLGNQISGEVNVDYGEKPTDCRKAAETLLKSLHSLRTYAEAGSCISAPKQRLKIGDSATLRTSTYLRTGPRWAEETRIRLVPSATVKIIGGPVCAIYNKGEYSYWQVDLSNGEKGWIAEGDLNEYYLVPKK